jgi:hypothetical protein
MFSANPEGEGGSVRGKNTKNKTGKTPEARITENVFYILEPFMGMGKTKITIFTEVFERLTGQKFDTKNNFRGVVNGRQMSKSEMSKIKILNYNLDSV